MTRPPMTRRQLLAGAGCGFGGLAFAGLASEAGLAAAVPGIHHAARAKRVIFLFMAGGVSQVDSFDWKPRLLQDDGRMLDFADDRAIARGGTGFIIVGATTFAQILSFSGASNGLAEAITGAGLPPWAVVAGMMLMLIFLGIFVDQVSMMMITLPIFMPVVTALNVDLIWFGVLFLICMQLGLLLPPHGLLLMTMKGVAPREVTMLHIFQAVAPYVAMSLILLALVFFVPKVATWLPALIG